MKKRTDLEDLDLTDAIAALNRTDFSIFTQLAFRAVQPEVDLVWAPYLDLVCGHLEAVAHGAMRHLIITMPPRHLKSFCVSVALPAYYLAHYPGKQVLCVSYGQDLARKFSQDTQTLMKSPAFLDLFGPVLTRDRQQANLLTTGEGGVRRATSIDGTATGLGCDLLIFDDPQKPGETLSDAVRGATNAAYEGTFLSRRNDPSTACIVIVMQRLHDDDFVAHVQGKGGADWTVINLPAIAEEDEVITYKTLVGSQTYTRAQGQALHPARVPLEMLAHIRSAMGEGVWATQYQQRPTPAGGGLVKVDWFRRYDTGTLNAGFDRIVQSWDTANKTEEWHDYSVCTTWGVKGKHVYLLDVFRKRLTYPDLRKAVLRQAQMHDAGVVYIEDKASGTQVYQELRVAGFGKLRPIKPTADKQIRMTNQTAQIEAGFVHLPKEAPWLDDYLHELTVFPNGKHADQVDSTSQALDNIFSFGPGENLMEYYRQEAEALQGRDGGVWVLRPPSTETCLYDIEGHEHRPMPDGCFHLTRKQAAPNLNLLGWTLVSRPPESAH